MQQNQRNHLGRHIQGRNDETAAQPISHYRRRRAYPRNRRRNHRIHVPRLSRSARRNALFSLNPAPRTLTHVVPQMRQFTNIMFSGLINKLKKLRLGFLEAGCGWVPFIMSKIEERLERVAPKERPILPSELLTRRQIYFQCGEEITTKRDVELLGDDCLLWASDFPMKRPAPICASSSKNISPVKI